MDSSSSLGRALFKWRSFTPVPVVLLLAGLLWCERGRSLPGDPTTTWALDAAGLLLAVLGQALRAWVLGQVPEGTSGQGNALEASTLNTTGPYARVRNPLYVGNALIVFGLLCLARSPLAAALALAFFFGQYHFIIRAEEGFLREKFGERFEAWCREVPRWVPRLRPLTDQPLSHRFDWRRALRKEHNPFAAWASGAIALLGWQLAWPDAARLREALPLLVGAELLLLATFTAVKGWKHRWWRAPAA